jgi:hypothetical protein
MINLPPTQ